MDWQGHSDEVNKTVEVAVIKIEATVPVTDPTYGGAVILNPGGPGGSGIGQVLRGGKYVRTLLSAGPEIEKGEGKHFDVYGFDPRGVNNTTPTIICQPDSIAAGKWEIETNAYGYIGTSDTSFDNVWASRRALAEGCSKGYAEQARVVVIPVFTFWASLSTYRRPLWLETLLKSSNGMASGENKK
ncbi:hypothetical protein LTR95_013460 [Oleoguttula sp. CCFEE 5521]